MDSQERDSARFDSAGSPRSWDDPGQGLSVKCNRRNSGELGGSTSGGASTEHFDLALRTLFLLHPMPRAAPSAATPAAIWVMASVFASKDWGSCQVPSQFLSSIIASVEALPILARLHSFEGDFTPVSGIATHPLKTRHQGNRRLPAASTQRRVRFAQHALGLSAASPTS